MSLRSSAFPQWHAHTHPPLSPIAPLLSTPSPLPCDSSPPPPGAAPPSHRALLGSFWTWGTVGRLKVCPWAWGFFGGGVASEPGGWCQFAGKLQGLGTLLCRVHAARFGGCCQVWGASGFNVCSWIWAMLPSLRVISGLGGLKAAPAPVETSPAVPAAVPAVHFVRCWAPVWSCSTLWLVVSAARVAGWPPWRRAGVPPSDVFHLLCLR